MTATPYDVGFLDGAVILGFVTVCVIVTLILEAVNRDE